MTAVRDWRMNGISFYGIDRASNDPMEGARAVAKPLAFSPTEEKSAGWPDDGPTFVLRNDQVQSLVDQLWSLGFRPSEGTGSAGSLAQAEAHIKTLQSIVAPLVSAAASAVSAKS